MKHQDFWAGQTASASAGRSFRFSAFTARSFRFSVFTARSFRFSARFSVFTARSFRFSGETTFPVVPSAISGGGARFTGALVLTCSLAGREAGGEDGDENEEAVLHWVG